MEPISFGIRFPSGISRYKIGLKDILPFLSESGQNLDWYICTWDCVLLEPFNAQESEKLNRLYGKKEIYVKIDWSYLTTLANENTQMYSTVIVGVDETKVFWNNRDGKEVRADVNPHFSSRYGCNIFIAIFEAGSWEIVSDSFNDIESLKEYLVQRGILTR